MLFKGGRVFDGRGALLENHGVLIDGRRIARVAPLAEFEGWSGPVTDTTDATLLPGLADCHVHLCYTGSADPRATLQKMTTGQVVVTLLANAQENLRAGITAVRDCGGKDHLEFAVRDAIEAGTFPGPTIRAAGKMICMTGGHGSLLARVADGCDEVVKAVREQIHAGADLIKLMATGGVMSPGVDPRDAHYTAEEMTAGVHEAKRFRRLTASHAQGTQGILNAVRAGVDSIEHGIFMDQQCLDEMLAAGTFLVPTIAALKNILANADRGIPPHAVEKALAVAERHEASFRMFHRAGGRIAMGTDAGTPFNRHGDNTRELALMVAWGMAPAEALTAATSGGAELMGLTDRGVIAEGRTADLLLVRGDPTADIACAADRANHLAVYKGGQPVR